MGSWLSCQMQSRDIKMELTVKRMQVSQKWEHRKFQSQIHTFLPWSCTSDHGLWTWPWGSEPHLLCGGKVPMIFDTFTPLTCPPASCTSTWPRFYCLFPPSFSVSFRSGIHHGTETIIRRERGLTCKLEMRCVAAESGHTLIYRFKVQCFLFWFMAV